MFVLLLFVFFFKQKTAYEMRISDWSSDVCSSDLSSPRWDSPLPWQHSCPCSAAISASFFRSATSIVRCSRYSASTGDEEPLQAMWNSRAADRTGTAAVAAPPIDLLVRTAGPAGVEMGQPSTSRRSRPIRSAVDSTEEQKSDIQSQMKKA